MKYEKPKCECGEELIILEHTMHTTNNRKIKTDGRLAERNFGETATEVHAVELNCPSCCNSYEIEFDKGGRVLRGCH